MSAFSDSTYYIGQGQCFWAPRQAAGPIIGGYSYFGDTQSLQVNSKQKIVEVEENTSGFGGIALHVPVSTPLDFKLQLPIWSMQNLAFGLFSALGTANPGGTVSGEAVTAYAGQMSPLANFGLTGAPTLATATGIVTGVTVGTPGTGYTTPPTVTFTAPSSGVTATGTATISGGAVTGILITNPGSGYASAPTISFSGGGGTGAAATASITVKSLVAGTDFTYNAQFGQFTTLTSSGSFFASIFPPTTPVPLTAGYSYAANNGSNNILSAPSVEIALRFNGLNVAVPSGSGFQAVPVAIKRAKLDFMKMIDLISKKEGIIELDGAILFDSTATDGVYYGTFAKA